MSSQSLLGLPPVSAALRPVIPFLQRANELRTQDPVMAYWCAYHAAQIGISLKAKDPASRDVLFALLGFLERLKKEIGSIDALDIESVSSAYVENFALKVFAMADNEDRTGFATRSTAKKFLAAAHFLEVLKIFPKAEISESVEEKIKYAKWKAADIAKAFREGRKPAPGPAGQVKEDPEATPPASPAPHIGNIPLIVHDSPGASEGSSNQLIPSAPGPRTPSRFIGAHLDVGSYGVSGLIGGDEEATPGSWSTAATPGTERGPTDDWEEQPSPTQGTLRAISGDSGRDKGLFSEKKAWVSEELEFSDGNGYSTFPGSGEDTPDSSSNETLNTSDSSVASSSALSSPAYRDQTYLHSSADTGGWSGEGPNGTYGTAHPAQPNHPSNIPLNSTFFSPGFVPDPPTVTYADTAGTSHVGHLPIASALPAPPDNVSYSTAYQFRNSLPPSAPPIPSPPLELTPTIVAKAQKHCRFAISSLDYEDAEQARKELRAALAILGG
ncbi:hypothetical protein H0H87_012429 [Tephrocybe sp. NHM501043]|nr:hypothetical protein H0H87_012429 [Tephrocybe sp. NHM501043]